MKASQRIVDISFFVSVADNAIELALSFVIDKGGIHQ